MARCGGGPVGDVRSPPSAVARPLNDHRPRGSSPRTTCLSSCRPPRRAARLRRTPAGRQLRRHPGRGRRDPDLPRSTRIISGGSTADRFLLGLLRACADVVLLGAGALHAHPETVWTGQHAYPAAADAFAELLRAAGNHLSPSSPSSPPAGGLTPTTQRCAARRSCSPASGGPARSPAGSPPTALSSLSESRGRPERRWRRCTTGGTGSSCPRPGRTCSARCSPPIWSTNCS